MRSHPKKTSSLQLKLQVAAVLLFMHILWNCCIIKFIWPLTLMSVLYVEEFAKSILSSLVYLYFISNWKGKKGREILLGSSRMLYSLLWFSLLFYCISRNILHLCCLQSENERWAHVICYVVVLWKNLFHTGKKAFFVKCSLFLSVFSCFCLLAVTTAVSLLYVHFFYTSLSDCLREIWVVSHCTVFKGNVPHVVSFAVYMLANMLMFKRWK
jgi:hypothetical protein